MYTYWIDPRHVGTLIGLSSAPLHSNNVICWLASSIAKSFPPLFGENDTQDAGCESCTENANIGGGTFITLNGVRFTEAINFVMWCKGLWYCVHYIYIL